jgi:hypothetical protein
MTGFPSAAVRDHIEAKLAAATLERFPSPHLVVEGFFPDDVYDRMLECNPFRRNDGRHWLAPDKMKRVRQPTPYDRRRQVDLEKPEFDAPDDEKRFWSALAGALLGDDWLAWQVYETYPPFFDLRFGEAVLDREFFGRLRHTMFVQRHDADFSLGPHTDAPHRVFTCIFALASGTGFERYGTQFLRPHDPDARCWGDLHHDPADFDVATVVPYAPNTGVIFFKTRQSFHAVPLIDQEIPGQRYGMQLAYYEPPGGLLQDLSRPDLMENRTSRALIDRRLLGHTITIR